MDLVSLYQAGVKNAVASSGTSLTEEQVQLLSRFTKNIIILFDADPAGQKASLRSIELLLKQDFEVKVMTLPKGEDPDSYIIKFGREKFDEEVLRAKNFVEYQSAQFEEQGKFEDPAEMTKAIREIVRTLALVNDELKRNLLVKTVAKKFNLREKLIESELNSFLAQKSGTRVFKAEQQGSAPVQYTGQLDLTSKSAIENPYEKELVRLLFSGDEAIIAYIFDNIGVENYTDPKLAGLFEIVHNGYNESRISPAYLIDKIEDEELRGYILDLTLTDDTISRRWDDISYTGKIEKDSFEYAAGTVRNFLISRIDQQIKEKNSIISGHKDERLHIELMTQIKELQEERKTLHNSKK